MWNKASELLNVLSGMPVACFHIGTIVLYRAWAQHISFSLYFLVTSLHVQACLRMYTAYYSRWRYATSCLAHDEEETAFVIG